MPKVQSAIRPRPVSLAIRLNPQLTLPAMHHRFRRSTLELRGRGNDLNINSRSSRRVRSAPLLVQIPSLPTNMGI
eukprot:6090240-Alexandrium_andersonii.AAC.1